MDSTALSTFPNFSDQSPPLSLFQHLQSNLLPHLQRFATFVDHSSSVEEVAHRIVLWKVVVVVGRHIDDHRIYFEAEGDHHILSFEEVESSLEVVEHRSYLEVVVGHSREVVGNPEAVVEHIDRRGHHEEASEGIDHKHCLA